MTVHRPQCYRYEVSRPRRGLRLGMNRYGWQVIGLYAVAGRYCYCLKWAWAR